MFTPQAEEQLLIESSSDEEEAASGDDDNDSTNKTGEVSPQLSGRLVDVEDMGKVVKKMEAAAKKQ